ncbi:hypothetical protein [Jidongwangia harbinensis]|uniref:hypothetical protein n=1 Tax=Jidongwangia harbinensis TaxID=2878561 RepID=UPI001CD98EAE|nr:hypothetical protein [Jidongwangia harbinensis]MCA2219236.1 hypothetical protein [Jidongwangia harbinensis]
MRTLALGAAALTGSAALTVAAPTAAHAAVDPQAAMTACRLGVGGSTARLHLAPQSLGVYVGSPGAPLQTQIADGAVVRVTATGRISYGGIFNWRGTWGPDGNGQSAPFDSWWPYPGGPDAALVGQWNHTGARTRIGSNSGCLYVPRRTIASAPYGLWLKANDDYRHLGDNGDVGYAITVSAWLYYG